MSESSLVQTANRIHFTRGKPAAIARRFGFDNIQHFRRAALLGDDGYRARRSPNQIAHFVGRTTRATWDDSNNGGGLRPGQRRWDERVVLATQADNPVAIWSAARNVSSRIEQRLVESRHGGRASTLLGMVERGIKRVFVPNRKTFVVTKEYAALRGYEDLIPQVGALALAAYPERRPGTIYLTDEDSQAKETVPCFGYVHDGGQPVPKPDMFGSDTTTDEERWLTPHIGDTILGMLLEANTDRLPEVEDL